MERTSCKFVVSTILCRVVDLLFPIQQRLCFRILAVKICIIPRSSSATSSNPGIMYSPAERDAVVGNRNPPLTEYLRTCIKRFFLIIQRLKTTGIKSNCRHSVYELRYNLLYQPIPARGWLSRPASNYSSSKAFLREECQRSNPQHWWPLDQKSGHPMRIRNCVKQWQPWVTQTGSESLIIFQCEVMYSVFIDGKPCQIQGFRRGRGNKRRMIF